MRLRVMAYDATGACHDKRDAHALVLQLLLWTCSPSHRLQSVDASCVISPYSIWGGAVLRVHDAPRACCAVQQQQCKAGGAVASRNMRSVPRPLHMLLRDAVTQQRIRRAALSRCCCYVRVIVRAWRVLWMVRA